MIKTNKIVVMVVFLSLLTLSTFSAINTNAFAQATGEPYLSKPDILNGSGQIATAHWSTPGIQTIDAFFAEQLTIDDTVVLNGLYISVLHSFGGGFYSGNYICVSDLNIERNDYGEILRIFTVAEMAFTRATASKDHIITLDWDFADEFAYISIIDHKSNNDFYERTTKEVMVDRTENPSITASVNKISGNKNELTITVTAASYFDFVENEMITIPPFTETFLIDNNTAGTYDVGVYKVYVDTKGNDQIRACYIVATE